MQSSTSSSAVAPSEATQGVLALFGAFSLWGVMPLYLRLLSAVPALQITMARLVFCCVIVVGLLRARGEHVQLLAALRTAEIRKRLMVSASLICINWLTYVWAVNHAHVIEASLGYFINPLINVLLGVLVLRERLRRWQWVAVGLAGVGVAYLTWQARAAPYIALILALSFGSYGLLRKTVAVDAMAGLGAETLMAAPFGIAYLAYVEVQGSGWLLTGDIPTRSLLALSGALTALPLGLFSYGARRVAYSTVGVIQYIGPTLQLLVGVFLFHEAFPRARALGFSLIWLALVMYALDGLRQRANARVHG